MDYAQVSGLSSVVFPRRVRDIEASGVGEWKRERSEGYPDAKVLGLVEEPNFGG